MTESISDDFQKQYTYLCTQIGYLFHSWANLESVFTAILKLHLSYRMSDEPSHEQVATVSAIYGSLRFKVARDTIKRIAVVEKMPKDRLKYLSSVFSQIGEIEGFRDKLAHNMLSPAYEDKDNVWQLNDAFQTRNIYEPNVWVFHTDAIWCAAQDLILAYNKISGKHNKGALFGYLTGPFEPIPWQYKPSMLKLIPQSKLRNPE